MSCPHGEWHAEDCEVCTLTEKLAQAEAEVERLKWMLDEATSCTPNEYASITKAEQLADLERRWAERGGEK